ncbi:protein bric-a-brac 1 isoform X2 [Uranotaenia lowii]|uniref:protein bric-a-brac 1 isoform X2 n=1 Tax=Uranotaenia lowii TaxID=190385 RepID=UPI00247AFB6D|nr:protein bric-a-brac 1 isoform X2 [Uranotaenia lowii]
MPSDTPPLLTSSSPTEMDHVERRPASVPSTTSGLPSATFKRNSLLDKSDTPLKPTLNQNQQFCLRWNNYQTNLTSVFDQLLQNESFVDVTLACDGQSIKAHKMVLSACSPYFQTLFHENPCQHPIVIMRDVKWPELKAIVDFMYKGEINVSQEQIGPLLKIAEMLRIRGLADVNGDQELNQIEHTGPSAKDGSESGSNNDSPTGSIKIEARTIRETDLRNNNNPMAKKPRAPRDREPTREISIRDFPRDLSREMATAAAVAAAAAASGDWPLRVALDTVQASTPKNVRKRRWPSGERSSVGSPADSTPDTLEVPSPIPPTPSSIGGGASSSAGATANNPLGSFPIPPALDHMAGLSSLSSMSTSSSHPDDLEIKPGIAEMIREEERAKMLENSQVWLGASTSSIPADSYQYQLQAMWQKCWNSQNLIHHLRFRERGPLKSWRPETMAEAIFSVLKEGLSLSQAARKYDIPYPTFVLYANRVHNMLGPSIDGGTDLRPKGRGRPQRILLGIWPDDHIKGVIKSVVFRDTKDIKEEHIIYGRHSPYTYQDNTMNFAQNANGQLPTTATEGMSSDALTAATVAAVRQQMCNMVAAAQHHPDATANLAGFNMPSHHGNLSIHPSGSAAGSSSETIPVPKLGSPAVSGQCHSNNAGGAGGIQMPRLGSPAVSSQCHSNNGGTGGIQMPRLGSPAGSGMSASKDHHGPPGLNPVSSSGSNSNTGASSINARSAESSRSSTHSSSSSSTVNHHHQHNSLGHLNNVAMNITRLGSPMVAHDLRMSTPPNEESPLTSPMAMALEPAVNLAVGGSVSDLGVAPYGSSKSSSRAGYSSTSSPPRPEHLFPDQDIASLMANRGISALAATSSASNDPVRSSATTIKLEPMTECRGD